MTLIETNCEMSSTCDRPVTMIDDKGFIYCTECGIARRSEGSWGRRCRKLRPHELNRILKGLTVEKY